MLFSDDERPRGPDPRQLGAWKAAVRHGVCMPPRAWEPGQRAGGWASSLQPGLHGPGLWLYPKDRNQVPTDKSDQGKGASEAVQVGIDGLPQGQGTPVYWVGDGASCNAL